MAFGTIGAPVQFHCQAHWNLIAPMYCQPLSETETRKDRSSVLTQQNHQPNPNPKLQFNRNMNAIMDRPSRSKIKEGIHPVFLAAKIIFCPNQAFAAINRPIRHALNARSLN